MLALTAIGRDVRDVGGYDLLMPLADLDRAPGIEGLTALKCSARLAAGERCEIPALRAENGKAHLDGTVEVTGWK